MRTLSLLCISIFTLTGCRHNSDIPKNYEKVVIISLDTNVFCDELVFRHDTSEIYVSDCLVVDTMGNPLFKKTNQTELLGDEKKWVVTFFETYKDTLTGTLDGSDHGTTLYFRDAVCLFDKSIDKIPTKIYWISFPNSKIKVKGQVEYLPSTINALDPLAKIFIGHRLKTKPKFGKSWG